MLDYIKRENIRREKKIRRRRKRKIIKEIKKEWQTYREKIRTISLAESIVWSIRRRKEKNERRKEKRRKKEKRRRLSG